MTTIEALFDLYEALGGDADEISTLETIPELLEEISEIAGSTIELPGVTASDNGDVLTVVGGKWAKAASGLPEVYPNDNGKVLTVVDGEWAKASTSDSTTKSFTKAGLTGTVKRYGDVATIEICTKEGTITSKSASLGFTVPNNLMYISGASPKIPLYQDGTQVGYFTLTPSGTTTTISVTVSSPVSADNSPVYANFTTL